MKLEPKSMKPTIIVIGSADIIKLGLIRSFGESGYKVISIHITGANKFKIKPLDYYSKYVSAYYFTKTTNLVDLLIDKCRDEVQKPILMPLTDSMVYLIDQSLSKLNKYFIIPNINLQEGGVTRLMNKVLQKKIAAEANLNVPKTWDIPFVDGDFIIPEDIEYPCFVKGSLSYKSKKQYQKRCNNLQELNELLTLCKRAGFYNLCAEEYLEIDKEVGIIAFSSETGCVIPAFVEFLEMGKSPKGGISMRGQICPANEQKFLQAIKSFLTKTCYVGICNFDFIVSRGKYYFVEVNFRYAAYGYGVFKSGVKVPDMITCSLLGGDLDKYDTLPNCNKTYFNEKVGLIDVMEGSITYKKYKEMKERSDILMIANPSDPKPHNMVWSLILNYMITFAITKIKKIVVLKK
jgi:predicted ATP-grasp superfamily ATP-dependent carboligase